MTAMNPTSEAASWVSDTSGKELVLALDAGGTKTAAWLVEAGSGSQHRILGRGRSTAGNPMSVGFAESTRVIMATIEQARCDANRAKVPVARAVFSIAGALDAEVRRQFIDWAQTSEIADDVAVVPDPLPVLAAGTPECVGVALICGTGSSAFARAEDGRSKLCGGWGYLLGDEGSGYAIGRAALRTALDDEELNAPRRPLSAAVLKQLQVQTAIEASKAVYRSGAARATVASLAPLVTRAAEEDDSDAVAIVEGAARDLAALVARAVESVGLASGPFALAVTGGVMVGSMLLQKNLRAVMSADGMSCKLGVVDDPLEGCVRLAEPQFAEVAAQWR